MRTFIPRDDRPVVIYNCDRQEMIGIFDTPILAYKYICGKATSRNAHKLIHRMLTRKQRIESEDNLHGFPMAARYATEKQAELIGSERFKLLVDYIEPMDPSILEGVVPNTLDASELRSKKTAKKISVK